MFEAIRSAFIKNLHSVDWMDDKTRNYAEEKAKAINKMLGYPDFVGNPTSLDQHYENVSIWYMYYITYYQKTKFI